MQTLPSSNPALADINNADDNQLGSSHITHPQSVKYYMPNSTSMNLLNKINGMELEDMKIQIFYAGLITVIYFKDEGYVELDKFNGKIKEICKFDEVQPFTIKWVDEEGDPCTISSQRELDEVIRLYYLNKERELVLHVFANVPERPGISQRKSFDKIRIKSVFEYFKFKDFQNCTKNGLV